VILLGSFKDSQLIKPREAKALRLKQESKLAKDRNFTDEEITDAIGIACY
jgi:hypothetical protein